ncbi:MULTISPECIES: hypothetical protein [Clostridium]|uniref:Uncharacterized protein n=3 Tax=Clostridium TaxID=1485 RepID=D8GM12_CLOLD|nr:MULTISPECIES: hypothetical protein [Clostridium]ADK15586.1 hypothetical protein CLJU_c25280 [Clostridium ljungdahlii DSM 13528]AGY74826.1 hypothetical protein CAETHG_0597 [Clostridium autoethanogenum DSM 10061]ALU35003.1 Hypothetical protein CLAU_0574 [Clostridium autoethanogenum DSM 10061]OAA85408.1 hypothetical protein WX45_00373 [Clostridium ljungdahlii DSM 13528]OVY51607.1 hypothetical protein WX72_01740 [Clostridium autoethanogenum]
MDKVYTLILKYIKKIKKSIIFGMQNLNLFFDKKKTIDTAYKPMLDEKLKEVKDLKDKLNVMQNNNASFEKQIKHLRGSMMKKEKLIKNLQDIISQRQN